MLERFILDREQNILFINFAGARIESRAQVDEFARVVREAYESQSHRLYAVVNYEGTEIAPDIINYYGERIKTLQDAYALRTVRYSSSGFTRSVLRYLGAAKDLESNTYATREEAIRAIQELKNLSRADSGAALWSPLDPRRSLLGKLALVWLAGVLGLMMVYACVPLVLRDAESQNVWRAATGAGAIAVLMLGAVTGMMLLVYVIKPLQQMEGAARQLTSGGATA